MLYVGMDVVMYIHTLSCKMQLLSGQVDSMLVLAKTAKTCQRFKLLGLMAHKDGTRDTTMYITDIVQMLNLQCQNLFIWPIRYTVDKSIVILTIE